MPKINMEWVQDLRDRTVEEAIAYLEDLSHSHGSQTELCFNNFGDEGYESWIETPEEE